MIFDEGILTITSSTTESDVGEYTVMIQLHDGSFHAPYSETFILSIIAPGPREFNIPVLPEILPPTSISIDIPEDICVDAFGNTSGLSVALDKVIPGGVMGLSFSNWRVNVSLNDNDSSGDY